MRENFDLLAVAVFRVSHAMSVDTNLGSRAPFTPPPLPSKRGLSSIVVTAHESTGRTIAVQ
jgi:hypothetical protein